MKDFTANSTRTKRNFAISLFSFTSTMCSTSFVQSQLQPSTALFCVFVLWDLLIFLPCKFNWNLQQDLSWRWARAIFFIIVSNALHCRPIDVSSGWFSSARPCKKNLQSFSAGAKRSKCTEKGEQGWVRALRGQVEQIKTDWLGMQSLLLWMEEREIK